MTARAIHWPPNPFESLPWSTFLLVALATLSGALVPFDFRAILLILAPIGALCLVQSATARLLFVVVVGMVVLQSSDGLSLVKLFYFSGVLLSVLVASARTRVLTSPSGVPPSRTLVGLSVPCASLLMFTSYVAHAHGTPLSGWLRDAAPYFLITAVPILALDAVHSSRARDLAFPLFVALGLLSSLSFAVEWVNRRGIGDLPIDRLLLPTNAPAVALFCYATSKVMYSRSSSWFWISVTLSLIGLLLVTATRASALWLVGPLTILFRRRDLAPNALLRLIIIVVLGIGSIQVASKGLSGMLDTERTSSRLQEVRYLPDRLDEDRSFLERRAQTLAAWEVFRHNLIAGTGPGAPITWSVPWRANDDSFNVDTAVSYLAKFGIVGAVTATAFASVFVWNWRSLQLSSASTAVNDAMVGLAAVTAVNLPLANPLEDKGFAFTVLLLFVVGMSHAGPGLTRSRHAYMGEVA